MGRLRFRVGDLVGIDPGYHSGIWLRSDRSVGISREVDHVDLNEVVMIVEVDNSFVRVISSGGVMGWTWDNRLRKLED